MPHAIVRAGTMDKLLKRTGDWLFVDIGFSRGGKTCGLLAATVPAAFAPLASASQPGAVAVTYGQAKDEIVSLGQQPGGPLHLVLEAPLSVAFGIDGNPIGRDGEKRGSTTRYWYVGLGCSVLVASLYLLEALAASGPKREVRLFEGLVSFKDPTEGTDHIADVEALKRVVWSGGKIGGRYRVPAPQEGTGGATVRSTLSLLGLDRTPPPIIEVAAG